MGGADGAAGGTPQASESLGVGGAGSSGADGNDLAGLGGSPAPARMEGGAGGGGSGADAGGSPGSAGTGGNTSACPSELLSNGGFEAGLAPWVAYTTGVDPLTYDAADSVDEGVIPHGGQRLAWLGGVPSEVNRLSQNVSLPASVTRVTFAGALRIQIFEQHSIVDFLRASLVSAGQRLPLFEFDNGDAAADWSELDLPPLEVTAYAGQTLTLEIESSIGVGPGTNFFLDDLTLVPECVP